jgi:outer membrane protein assembly factor BamB
MPRLVDTSSAMSNSLLISISAALILSGAIPNVATAQARFREYVLLDVERQAVKRLETAKEHLIEQQWDQAIPILQQLIDTTGQSLVPVEPGRYWNTAEFCHLLMSRMPAEGLALYRERVDGQAREWFEQSRDRHDDDGLRHIIGSMFNSSYGDDALWLLGEFELQRGRTAQARQLWQRLIPPFAETSEAPIAQDENVGNLDADQGFADRTNDRTNDRVGAQAGVQAAGDAAPREKANEVGQPAVRPSQHLTFPDSHIAISDVMARLILCSIFEDDLARATEELAVFQSLYSDAEGAIGGRSGRFVDLLQQFLDESRTVARSVAGGSSDSMFGASNSRNPDVSPEPRPQVVTWHWKLPDVPEPRRPNDPLRNARPPALLPIVHDGTVFVGDSFSLFALDVKTGQPRWPTDNGDVSGRILVSSFDPPMRPHSPTAGTDWHTVTVSNGRLFARMGPPLLRRSRNEGNAYSEIVGLDIDAQQGALVFRVTSDAFDPDAVSPEATSWSFEGAPIVDDDRVFLTARRGTPEEEVVIACFDATTSRLLWKRRVCVSLRQSADHFNVTGTRLLTLGDGRLFLNTELGAITAFDAESGNPLWAVTYPSQVAETQAEFNHPDRSSLTPCLYDRGIVYCAASDSRTLFALDATTGQLVWQREQSQPIQHLLGVIDDRLIVSGRSLQALDAATGLPAWPDARIGFEDSDGFGFGRGVLTDRHIYWPIRNRILIVDHRTGQLAGSVFLRETFAQRSGHLLVDGATLLVVQSDGIIAIGPERDAGIGTGDNESGTPQPRRQGVIETAQLPNVDRNTVDETSTEFLNSALPRTELWPARRVWSQAVSQDQLINLVTTPDGTTAVTAFRSGELVRLNSNTGKLHWRCHTVVRPTQQLLFGHRLVTANDNEVEIRDIESGQLLDRRSFSETSGEPLRLIRGHGNRLAVLSADRAIGLDVSNGKSVWEHPSRSDTWTIWNTARSHSSPVLESGTGAVLFRPRCRNDASLLKLDSGRVVERGPLDERDVVEWSVREFATRRSHAPDEMASSNAPSPAAKTSIIATTIWHDIVQMQPGFRVTAWSYRVDVRAHGNPVVLQNGVDLVVIEGAQFATRLDAQTGVPLWRIPLGPLPLASAAGSTSLSDQHLLAVSDGALRSFRVADGKSVWTQFLGPGDWALKLDHSAVICLPQPSRRSSMTIAPEDGSRPIVICDSVSGRLIQKLQTTLPVSPSDLAVGRGLALLKSGGLVTALQPYVVQGSHQN